MCRLKNVSMLHTLRVLEYGFGFDFSQFDYLEFYDSPVELPYCLFFRLSGKRDTYTLRIPRCSDENGFFRTEIGIASETAQGSLIDCRMLNVSWFKLTFPACDVIEELDV